MSQQNRDFRFSYSLVLAGLKGRSLHINRLHGVVKRVLVLLGIVVDPFRVLMLLLLFARIELFWWDIRSASWDVGLRQIR